MRPAAATLRRWRENPLQFFEECTKFRPDPWAEDAGAKLSSQVQAEKRISLQACTGAGKSAFDANALLWFIATHGDIGEHPKAACISISADNLSSNLWAELAKWHGRSEFLKRAFEWTATRYKSRTHPETWWIDARSWSKRADAEAQGRTLSGLHARWIMAVIDEAGDIPVPVLRSAEQIFSSEHEYAKIIMSGNPTSLEGALYHAASVMQHMWVIVPITGDPNDPRRAPRVDIDNAREQIALYGPDNPWVMATILGKFPPGGINSLLSLDEVIEAQGRHLQPSVYNWAQKRLGADVALFGDDRSVLFPRQGKAAFKPVIMRSQNTAQIAARAAEYCEGWGSEQDIPLIIVDNSFQWGQGTVDQLLLTRWPVIPVKGEAPASDPRYANIRAQMHFRAAEHIKAGGALPPDVPGLAMEAIATTYSMSGGKFIMKPKKLVKKDLGRSPDLWDGFCNTFAVPEAPRVLPAALRGRHTGREREEYDPFA